MTKIYSYKQRICDNVVYVLLELYDLSHTDTRINTLIDYTGHNI